MAEFRSSAREGSFSENQFSVPDEVSKIQTAASRRISGMNSAQAALQEQNRLFLQAQQNAQQVNQRNRNDIYGVQEREAQAFKRSSEFAYKKELERERAKNKFKVDTLGLLTNFSKTAASVVGAINKMDQDNMLRATNEVQFKQGFTFEDLKNAQSIKDTINDSETQRTAVIQQYLKEGKSPEFINAFNEHLVKNGGYRNYIGNATILTDLGRAHASELSLIANDDTLTPDQKRLALDTKQAELRASIEIDGRIPSPKILEQAYNPYIKNALRDADRVINKQSFDLLNRNTRIDRERNFINAAFEGGEFTPGNALNQAQNSPRPNIVYEIASTLVAQNLPVDHLNKLKTEVFTGPNGKATTIESGGYTEALSLINAKIKERKNQDRQAFDDAMKVRELQAQQQVLDGFEGQPVSKQMVEEAIDFLDKEVGHQRDRSFDQYLLNQTVEADAIKALTKRFNEDYENGTLSVASLEAANSPTAILTRFKPLAQEYDNARAKIKDEGIIQALEERIEGALKEKKGIPLTLQGELQGDQTRWYVEATAKKYATQYLKAIANGQDDFEAFAAAAILEAQNVKIIGGRITAYDTNIEQKKRDYYTVQDTIQQITQLRRDGKLTASRLYNILGESKLIEASEQLKQTGQSTVLDRMAAQFDSLTPYELQNKLAEVSDKDGIEPVEAPKTFQQLIKSFSAKERHDFTSDLTRIEAKIRVLTPRMNQTFPVRSSFGDRSLNSFAPQVSSIVMEDDSGEPGMDIFFENKQFPAVLGGVVKEKTTEDSQLGNFGHYIIVEGTDPYTGEKVDVLYSHLESPSDLQVGRTVLPGMIVGTQGGTGNVVSYDGTIASIDFLAPAPAGSKSMVPYQHYKQLRERIAQQLTQ